MFTCHFFSYPFWTGKRQNIYPWKKVIEILENANADVAILHVPPHADDLVDINVKTYNHYLDKLKSDKTEIVPYELPLDVVKQKESNL